ncbi:MAG: hypothetical protein ABIA74_00235 [bacterium]
MDNPKTKNEQNEQLEIYKAIQEKKSSKIREMARKFVGFLKKGFPSRLWSCKRDNLKGHKF